MPINNPSGGGMGVETQTATAKTLSIRDGLVLLRR